MATRKITQADTRKTFALYNSADITLLTDIANASTRVRFVNVVVGSDTSPKVISVDETSQSIPQIGGWTQVYTDSIKLTVDGQVVDLMYDPLNNTWEVVNQYCPPAIVPYVKYQGSAELPEPTPDLLWRINFTNGGGVEHYGEELTQYYLDAAGIQLYDVVFDVSGYGSNFYGGLIPGVPLLFPGTAVVDYMRPELMPTGPVNVSWIKLGGNDADGNPLIPLGQVLSAQVAGSIDIPTGFTATVTKAEIYDENVQLVGTFPVIPNNYDYTINLTGVGFDQGVPLPIPSYLAGTAYSVWMYGDIGLAPTPAATGQILWQGAAGQSTPILPAPYNGDPDFKIFLSDFERSNVIEYGNVPVLDYPLMLLGYETPQSTSKTASAVVALQWERVITAAEGCEISFSESGPWTRTIKQQVTPYISGGMSYPHDYLPEIQKVNASGNIHGQSFQYTGAQMAPIQYYCRRIDTPARVDRFTAPAETSGALVQPIYQFRRPLFIDLEVLPIGQPNDGSEIVAAKPAVVLDPNTTLRRFNDCISSSCAGGNDASPGQAFEHTSQATIAWNGTPIESRYAKKITAEYIYLYKDIAFKQMAMNNGRFFRPLDNTGYDTFMIFPERFGIGLPTETYADSYNGFDGIRFPFKVQMSYTSSFRALIAPADGLNLSYTHLHSVSPKIPLKNGVPVTRMSDWPAASLTVETNTDTDYSALYSITLEPGAIEVADRANWVEIKGYPREYCDTMQNGPDRRFWKTAENKNYQNIVASFYASPTGTSDGVVARTSFYYDGFRAYWTKILIPASPYAYYVGDINNPKPPGTYSDNVVKFIEGVPTKSPSILKYEYYGGNTDFSNTYFTEYKPWDADLAVTVFGRLRFKKTQWADPLQTQPIPNASTFALDLPYFISDTPAIGVAGGVNSAALFTNLFRDTGSSYTMDTANVQMLPAVHSMINSLSPAVSRDITSINVDLPNEVAAFPLPTIANDTRFMQIGSELMQVVAITPLVFTQYDRNTGAPISTYSYIQVDVKRGVLDTIPTLHAVDDAVVFFTANKLQHLTQYQQGSINYKLVPTTKSTSLILAQAPVLNVSAVNRALLPLPPGNVKIKYDAENRVFDNLTLTWSHRNRLDNAVNAYTDVITQTEPGVTYTIEVVRNGNVIDSAAGLTTTTHTLTKPQVAAGNTYTVRIKSIRAGLSSYQTYEMEFMWGLAPVETITITQPQDNNTTVVGDSITITTI